MLDVTVAVVGGGPAALGAAIALRGRGQIIVIAPTPQTQGWPCFLGTRAQRALIEMGLDLPAGDQLDGSTVVTHDQAAFAPFESRPMSLTGTQWSTFVDHSLASCEHPVLRGQAHLEDVDEGILQVSGESRLRIRAQFIIWSAGSPPPQASIPVDAGIHVQTLERQAAQSRRLRFILGESLPADAPCDMVSSWQLPSGSRTTHGSIAFRDRFDRPSSTPSSTPREESQSWRRNVCTTYSRPHCVIGRVMLTGGAAGLINRLTGEGISFALTSGRIAAEATLRGPDWRSYFNHALTTHFGVGIPDSIEHLRRQRLALSAIDGAIRSRTPARDRIVGLMLDQGINLSLAAPVHRTKVSEETRHARSRVRSISARAVSRLWLSAAPSFASLPSLPDFRLSDVLLGAAGSRMLDPRIAIAGGAVDLLASSIGFLAAGVSENDVNTTLRRNWSEIASVVAHDVLAARALQCAARAGEDILETTICWLDSVARIRQSQRKDRTDSALPLFELAFELPARLAALLHDDVVDATPPLVRIGHLLGASFALGEETLLLQGKPNRLGLSATAANAFGLRCRHSEILGKWTPTSTTLRTAIPSLCSSWSEALIDASPYLGCEGASILTTIFSTNLGDLADSAAIGSHRGRSS